MGAFYIKIITWLSNHQLPCFIKKTFNIECPGCGLQRSFIALLKGDILQSLQFYPALIPLLFLIFTIILNRKIQSLILQKCIKIGIPLIFILILLSYIYKLAQ